MRRSRSRLCNKIIPENIRKIDNQIPGENKSVAQLLPDASPEPERRASEELTIVHCVSVATQTPKLVTTEIFF